MSRNRELEHAWRYHEETKHSYVSVRTGGRPLDWSNYPYLFKVYLDRPSIELPRDFPRPSKPALEALSPLLRGDGEMDVGVLAELLFFSAGITRVKRYGGEVMYFRAMPTTGALYHVELYVVSSDIEGLEAGVYHFDPGEFKLSLLRKGDYRGYLYEAAGWEKSILEAPLSIVLTSFWWRNAWKYGARTYRHCFWDSGVLAANMLAVAHSEDLAARVVMGFVDRDVGLLLGLDERLELPLAIIPIGSGGEPPKESPRPSKMEPKVMPPSRYIIDYREIREIHEASSLESPGEVREWRERAGGHGEKPLEIDSEEIALGDIEERSPPLWKVILRRGSTRRFSLESIGLEQLGVILRHSLTGVAADFHGGGAGNLTHPFLMINDVDGLEPGSYYYDWASGSLRRLRKGRFREMCGYLCLEQELGFSSSSTAFLMNRLEETLSIMGNRGYRVAQFEAGVIAGRLYLSAYSLGLGATGLTFYDEDVVEFFKPYSEGMENMMVVALGRPAYRSRSGRIYLGVVKHQEKVGEG